VRECQQTPSSNLGIRNNIMLGWVLTFLVVALIAGALGFSGIAGAAAGVASILFWVFLILFLVSLVVSFTRRTVPPPV
jgi:uncharacterized membrane protein YtjA (UPF0391 family)